MAAYYNEIDPFTAQWLRNLIAAGLIAPGDVDERSIKDVKPDDIRSFEQCHFFAGIGGWSFAARLAGWPDHQPLWTGSCPCQPFSVAGKWPEFFRLISERRPGVVFGEQVASKDGLNWLDLVQADMERAQYAFAAIDLGAAGVGAPHIRQRLFWVGNASSERSPICEQASVVREGRWIEGRATEQSSSAPGGLDDSVSHGRRAVGDDHAGNDRQLADAAGNVSGLAHADGWHASAERQQRGGEQRQQPKDSRASELAHASHGDGRGGVWRAQARARAFFERWFGSSGGRPDGNASPADSFWRDADWICCTDGKWRPVEPGSFPLAHGVSGRMVIRMPGEEAGAPLQEHWYSRTGALRGFGNAIVPQAAAEFISAWMDCAT